MLSLALLSTVAFAAVADPYTDFLNGLLGALEPGVNGTVAPCISSSDTGFSDVRKAFLLLDAGIASRNITKIVQAGTYFVTALSDLRTAAQKCNAPTIVADLDTLISDLLTDPLGTLDKLLPHWYTIVQDFSTALGDFNSGNYTGAGTNIGNVLVILIKNDAPLKVVAAPLRVPPRADPAYVQFLNGLLTQLAPTVNGSVATCLKDSDGGLNQITRGFQLLEQGLQSGNFTAILSSLPFFEKSLVDLRTAATDCHATQLVNELDTLLATLASNPIAVLDKLLPHLPTVLSDLSGAVNAWQAQQYETAGEDIGKVFVILLTPDVAARPYTIRKTRFA